jgi:hypothetical protein
LRELHRVSIGLGWYRAPRRGNRCDALLTVAAALAAFREDEWVSQIGNGLTTVNVTVQQPAVEHHLRIKDFLARLEKKGSSPAEVSLREKLTKMLG